MTLPDEQPSTEKPEPEPYKGFVDRAVDAELHTGRREETEEQAKKHLLVRLARVSAGVVVLLLGIVMLAAPGPGVLVIVIGLGLLAQDVPFAARLLDRARRRLPQDADGKLPRSTVVSMVLICTVAVAASLGLTFWQMTK
jgi:uncharacterized protein (TIGR02611 family)